MGWVARRRMINDIHLVTVKVDDRGSDLAAAGDARRGRACLQVIVMGPADRHPHVGIGSQGAGVEVGDSSGRWCGECQVRPLQQAFPCAGNLAKFEGWCSGYRVAVNCGRGMAWLGSCLQEVYAERVEYGGVERRGCGKMGNFDEGQHWAGYFHITQAFTKPPSRTRQMVKR